MFSAIESPNRTDSCRTTEICARSESRVRSRTSSPSTETRPCTGSWSRGTSPTSVDFPLPVSPTIATVVPGRTSKSTPSSTVWSTAYAKSTPWKAILPCSGGAAGTVQLHDVHRGERFVHRGCDLPFALALPPRAHADTPAVERAHDGDQRHHQQRDSRQHGIDEQHHSQHQDDEDEAAPEIDDRVD